MNDTMDDYPDCQEKSKKKAKTPEEELEEEIYNKRVRLVGLSKSDARSALKYIHDNEKFFKSNYSDYDRKELRNNTCERILESPYATMSDAEYLNRIFGPRRDPEPQWGNTNDMFPDEGIHQQPIDVQLAWFANGTYNAFWNWTHDTDVIKRLQEHPELKQKLSQAIQDHIFENYVLLPDKGYKEYEQSDDGYYKDLLDSIRDDVQ